MSRSRAVSKSTYDHHSRRKDKSARNRNLRRENKVRLGNDQYPLRIEEVANPYYVFGGGHGFKNFEAYVDSEFDDLHHFIASGNMARGYCPPKICKRIGKDAPEITRKDVEKYCLANWHKLVSK